MIIHIYKFWVLHKNFIVLGMLLQQKLSQNSPRLEAKAYCGLNLKEDNNLQHPEIHSLTPYRHSPPSPAWPQEEERGKKFTPPRNQPTPLTSASALAR